VNNPNKYYDNNGHSIKSIIKKFCKKTKEIYENIVYDVKNLNLYNTSEQVVIDSKYFTFYKGVPFIKHYIIDDNVTSCSIFGIMFINGDDAKLDRGINTIKHEYGHIIQERIYGEYYYIKYIAIRSLQNRNPKRDYYSLPWEHGADVYGGVQGENHESDAYENILNTIKKY
jgi:hypothetical protein